jgi:hypothetical protein
MEAEMKVLRTLYRTARAIRRGKRLELLDAAWKWEQLLGLRALKLEVHLELVKKATHG